MSITNTNSRSKQLFINVGYRVLFVVSFLIVWHLVAEFLTEGLLPPPHPVGQEAYTLVSTGEFIEHTIDTVRRVTIPFFAAWAVSIALGVAMGLSARAEKFFDAGVVIGLTVPGLAWAIISVMIFGLSEVGAYFAVFVIVLPMITINFWEGVKDIDMDLIEMGEVFDFDRYTTLRRVILPQLYPYMLSAGRFGLSLCWKVVVIVEFLGFGSGIGYMILNDYNNFNMAGVLAWTALFTVLMLVIEYGGFKTLESHLLGWRPEVGVRSAEAQQ
ncbi:ABC transporter permease [Natrinema soli]|uniref:ABC transporter permease n=1 Tax=Natrinema soli TaxID=1930624 RepID=A0ABD5SLP8_9EURY